MDSRGARLPGRGRRRELSFRAVTAALEWQRSRLPAASGLLTADQTAALARAIEGAEPLSPELFDALVRMGLIASRCARELAAPACTVGDALTVASALPAPGGPPWTFEPRLAADAFEKLGFRRISDGIVRIQRANGAGWAGHAQASRRFILRAAEEVAGHGLAVLLGAGQAFDLPIVELARRFDRLVLIDVDETALAQTIDAAIEDPGLRAKIEPRIMDVTGIDGAMVRRIDEAFAAGGSGAEVQARLDRLCRSYRLSDGPAWLPPHEQADLLVSGLLLSQVSWPQRSYAHRLFSQRFGRPTGPAERQWIAPFWSFELQVQQDHVNALAGAAERVVLISDVVNVPTVLEVDGTERDLGVRVCGLGVDALAERIPQFLQIDEVGAWSWARYRPGGDGRPGSRMEVEALALRDAPAG